MENSKQDFIHRLSNQIITSAQLPKIQAERIVGPILTIYIEQIINKLFKVSIPQDKIELVSPEWPLKKKNNNQSTNIDWLMIQRNMKRIYFVELKTDKSSNNKSQLKIYVDAKKKIENTNAKFLLDDLDAIMNNARGKKPKYEILQDNIKSFKEFFPEIRSVELVYIVPSRLESKLKDNNPDLKIFSLINLPRELEGESEWATIYATLEKLDKLNN